MKTFKEFEYIRPDFEQEKAAIKKYAADIANAKSYEELRKVYIEREEESKKFNVMSDVAYIRNSIDTNDKFYADEMSAYYAEGGTFAVLELDASKALLESPFRKEFEAEFGTLITKRMEMSLKLASPEVVEDMAKDAELCQEFSRVSAGCKVEFNGEICNLSGLLKYMGDKDRAVRKAAFDEWAKFYESIADELDRIYDEMVAVRSKMAKKLGFDSYIDFIYAKMSRFDYGPADVAVYREQVRKHVVPLVERSFKAQAKRIGLEQLDWYDEKLTDPDGNAVPIGDRDQMIQWAKEMYTELSPETAEFFNFMTEHELYDLDARMGKMLGGYCSFLPTEKAPFIFANFNGTADDVDVLTHEAGHAFQAYTSSRIHPVASTVWGTAEQGEIPSMGMELFTYPWMEKFFGDKADRYRIRHIEYALSAVPYMICVDELQHRQYEENLDAAGRRRVWKELEEKYMPWRHYADNEFLNNGGFWMQKPHIFINPFYYVDYAIAQMSAFEFYQKMEENREQAWADYYKLCQSGGSRSYFDTLEHVGLSNPLKEGTLGKIMAFISTKISQ